MAVRKSMKNNNKKKIEKIINDFNYDIDKNEKLDNGDKYKKKKIIIKINMVSIVKSVMDI